MFSARAASRLLRRCYQLGSQNVIRTVSVSNAGSSGHFLCRNSSNGRGESNDAFAFVVQNILAALDPTERTTNFAALNQYSDYLSHDVVLEVLKRASSWKGAQFFRWVRRQRGYQHDPQAYEALLERLCNSRQCKEALSLMHAMRSDGLTPSLKSVMLLMRAYVDNGQIEQATDIFNHVKSLADVPAEAYSFMINALSRRQQFDEALSLSKEALSKGLKADHHMLLYTLTKAGKGKAAAECVEVLLANNCPVGSVDCSVVVDDLCKQGAVDRAVQILEQAVEAGCKVDAQAFNLLSVRLFKARRASDVIKLFTRLADKGIVYNDTTYKNIVDGVSNAGMITEALDLISQLRNVYPPSVFVYNGIITALCRSAKVVEAYQVLDRMMEENLYPNVYTYSILLNGLCKAGKTKYALRVFEDMKKNGLQPSPVGYGTLIQHLSRVGEIDEALRIMVEQRTLDLPTDVVTCTTMVGGLCKANRLDEALKFMEEMEKMGVRPNEFTYSSLVTGFRQKGEVDKIIDYLEQLKLRNGTLDAAAYPGLMDALCKANYLDKAEKALEEMHQMNIYPDLVTYSVLIKAFAKGDRFDFALKLLDEMKTRGIKPDVITYSGLINTLCRLNRLEEGYKVLEKMVMDGVKPNVYTYNSFLDSLCKSGQLDEVQKLYEVMLKSGCAPDEATFCIIMNGLSKAGKLDSAIKLFELLKNSKTGPSVVAYKIVIGNLCQAGKVEEACGMFESMELVKGESVSAILAALLNALCNAGRIDLAEKMLKVATERGQCGDSGDDFVAIIASHSKSKVAAAEAASVA